MKSILTAIEPTFPDPNLLKSHIYPSSRMAVIETSFLMLGDCECDQFHFLIPLKQAPVIKTERKLHVLKEKSVFPCNPRQLHRIEDTGFSDFKALVLYVENSLFQTAAEELFKKRDVEFRNNCFAFSPALRESVNAFIRECRSCQPGCDLMLESIAVQAAIILLRESSHNLSRLVSLPDIYPDEKAVNKAIEYISDNYRNRISLFDIAHETNYSPYHFLRLFKRYTGTTPFGFLLDFKIEKAKDMLKKTGCSISQVCDLCGFSSLSYFSRIFREKTGVTPTEYKKNA